MSRDPSLCTSSLIPESDHRGQQSAPVVSDAPRPWRIQIVGMSGHVIDAERNTVVAFDPLAPAANLWPFIVRAVNSHEPLVAALELALKRVEFYGQISDRRHFDHDLKEILPVINAALASVREVQP